MELEDQEIEETTELDIADLVVTDFLPAFPKGLAEVTLEAVDLEDLPVVLVDLEDLPVEVMEVVDLEGLAAPEVGPAPTRSVRAWTCTVAAPSMPTPSSSRRKLRSPPSTSTMVHRAGLSGDNG